MMTKEMDRKFSLGAGKEIVFINFSMLDIRLEWNLENLGEGHSFSEGVRQGWENSYKNEKY